MVRSLNQSHSWNRVILGTDYSYNHVPRTIKHVFASPCPASYRCTVIAALRAVPLPDVVGRAHTITVVPGAALSARLCAAQAAKGAALDHAGLDGTAGRVALARVGLKVDDLHPVARVQGQVDEWSDHYDVHRGGTFGSVSAQAHLACVLDRVELPAQWVSGESRLQSPVLHTSSKYPMFVSVDSMVATCSFVKPCVSQAGCAVALWSSETSKRHNVDLQRLAIRE